MVLSNYRQRCACAAVAAGRVACSLLVVVSLLPLPRLAGAQEDAGPLAEKRRRARLSAQVAARVNDQVAIIVVLADEPLATWGGERVGLAATRVDVAPDNRIRGKLNLESPASQAYLRFLDRAQQDFAARLRQIIPRAAVHKRYQIVLNGLAVTVPPEEIERLAALPEVKEIIPIVPLHVMAARPAALAPLDTSNDLMGAPALWEAVGGVDRAGWGITIGIIDTGVDFSNPMFQDPQLTPPPGFPRGDLSLANNKVIVAKVLPSLVTAAFPGIDPRHRTAQDLIGHGTHVASCAAGARVDLTSRPGARPVVISGVAPRAFIASYRVFAPVGGIDSLLDGIEEAVKDGVDVINISLGTPAVAPPLVGEFFYDQLDRAANNAVAAGVFVVAAAGNEGEPTSDNQNSAGGTIGSPASASRVLTVGATTNAHVGAPSSSLARLRIVEPNPPAELTEVIGVKGVNGARPFPDTPVSGPLVDVDLIDNGKADGSGLACSRLPDGSLTGAIAFIQRGRCFFSDKVENAAQAGARAVVFFNHADGGDDLAIPDLRGASLPAILIQATAGQALKEFIDQLAPSGLAPHVTMENAPAQTPTLTLPTEPHLLVGISSRGPARNFGIKPDVVTVGVGSYAAVQDDDPRGEARFPVPRALEERLPPTSYDPSGFTFLSGTSFAAPRAAGVAALVRQLHPSWTPDEIRSAIMTTAARPPALAERRVMDRGSGLINMSALARLATIADPPSHSFGRQDARRSRTLTRTFTLRNHASRPTTYQIALTLTVTDPAITATVNRTTLTVAPGSAGQVTLTLTIAPTVAAGVKDWEGFLSISDGEVTIPGSLYIPFWVRTVR